MKTAAKNASTIRFSAPLLRPASTDKRKAVSWLFLILPKRASAKLPSRGQVSVEGTINGAPLRATLQPDGKGGHWLKVERKVRQTAGAAMNAGDVVTLAVTLVSPDREPEPKMPADLRRALAADFPGAANARQTWADITPLARRDWIQWIITAKQKQTRARRIMTACDMLSKGKRRPCCFDRSGIYGKNLSCPLAADAPM